MYLCINEQMNCNSTYMTMTMNKTKECSVIHCILGIQITLGHVKTRDPIS